MRLTTLCLVFSLLAISFGLVGCATIPRPDSDLGGVVVNSDGATGKFRSYNLKTDYDDNGVRRPSAKPKEKPINSLRDLIGYTCTDAKGLKNIKTWLSDMRDEIQKRCGDVMQNRSQPFMYEQDAWLSEEDPLLLIMRPR